MGSDASDKKLESSDDVQRECAEIEDALAVLRASYEQFFLGLERHPPTVAHQALKRRLGRLKGSLLRQTAVKFRVASLNNKLMTYERLWNRTLQEIENGTYRRDLFKARLHSSKKAPPEPEKAPEPPPAAAPASGPPAVAPVVPKVPLAAKAPPPMGAAPGALSDAKLKAIYDAYVTAKRRCNEDVSKLTYDSLAATLRKQVPELMRQHKAQSIEFKVVIKDGKAVLRAVPK